jgi:Protein of unknown function (DUF1761)
MPMAEVNYLAILVAAVAAFVLGAVWYSPMLFGRPWLRARGWSPDRTEQMREGIGRSYGIAFVCYLVMASVLAMLFSFAGFLGATDGLWLGFLCWLGFAATIGLTRHLFSDRPFWLYLIDVTFQLAYLLAMGGIIGMWH